MRARQIHALGLLLFGACLCAAAQTGAPDPRNFDATSFGDFVQLGPNWLFAPGDNPAWASPALDDSGWKTISAERPLAGYGFRDLHYAWYRIHIHLRPGTRNISIGISGVTGNNEVYANGVRIGGSGRMMQGLDTWQESFISYPVPETQAVLQGDLVLAIRFAVNWRSAWNGGAGAKPLGSESVYLVGRESAPLAASYVAAHRAGPALLLCGLALIVSLIAFALYFALKSQREYLAIAICLLAASVVAAMLIWLDLRSFSFPGFYAQFAVLGAEAVALIEFVRLVLHLSRTRWFVALEIVSFLAFLVYPLNHIGMLSPFAVITGFYLPVLVMKIVLPLLLLRGGLRGNREAFLLLPAILIGSLADYWRFFLDLLYFAHFDQPLGHLTFSVMLGSYQIDFYRIGDFVFYIAILIFLVQRTVRIARERNRAAAELEAARTTQQLLLTRCSQPTPGFRVEAIYHPASEVGGDFFEVSSMPDGGLIAIVGDVSGKGLIAAMRVAMILGVLRREDSFEPAQILHNLNEALLTRDEAGFTTACCVHIEPSGRYTLSNAGHIAPYLDGREIPTLPSLPLGISPNQSYEAVSGSLAADRNLVFVSDGVVEARNAAGELLGFERLGPLTLKPAREIADTAKSFGQQDDITVLTLARTA